MTTPHTIVRSLLLLVLAPLAARGQIAYNCSSSLSWLDNGLGQDPCHVASSLLGQCYGSTYNLTALGTAFSGYAGPVSTDQADWTINGCLCSDPMYNLLMACQGACQGKNILAFNTFTGSCNSSFTGSSSTPTLNWPQAVPADTEIPPWALVNNIGGIWSEQQAQDNVSGVATTSSSPPPSSSTSSGTDVGPTSQPTGSSNSGKSSHAGAIAGGVVGGIAVIAVIAVAGMYMMRRLRKRDEAEEHRIAGQGRMNEVQPLSMMAAHPGNATSPSNTTSSGMRAGSAYGSQYGHGSQYGVPPSSESGGYGVNPFQGSTPSPRPDGAYYPAGSSSRLPEVMSSSTPAPRTSSGGAMSPIQPGVGNIYQQDSYDQYPGR